MASKALSIGRLAELLGHSKSGLFGHFGSKEALQQIGARERRRRFPRPRDPAGSARAGRARAPAALVRRMARLGGRRRTRSAAVRCSRRRSSSTTGPASCATISSSSKKLGSTASRGWQPRRSPRPSFAATSTSSNSRFEFNNIGLGFNFAHRLIEDARARQRANEAFEQLVASAAR